MYVLVIWVQLLMSMFFFMVTVVLSVLVMVSRVLLVAKIANLFVLLVA